MSLAYSLATGRSWWLDAGRRLDLPHPDRALARRVRLLPGALVGIGVTYLFADDLYTNRFLAEEQEKELNRQVERLSAAWRARGGDLTVRTPEVAPLATGRKRPGRAHADPR